MSEKFVTVEEVMSDLAVYIAPRAGELAALTWDDVDLRTGRIHIHRSIDVETGVVGPTKTGCDRRFVLEPAILDLLRAMRGKAPGDARIARWKRNMAAPMLRDHLLRAGCTRAELHDGDEQRRRLTFHDLRATAITWWAIRGDSIGDIMERAGHAQILTTQRYMRRGRLLVSGSKEALFPALPRDLLQPTK